MLQVDVLEQVTQGFEPGTKVHNVVTLFARTMLEPMLLRYGLYPAKGTTIAQFAHNSDQMMVTHLLNGLFPVLVIIAEAQKRNVGRLSLLTEEDLKIYILAYIMHDLDKILGEPLKTLTVKGTAEACQKLLQELEKLNAQAFLPAVEKWGNEILWLAVNTQRSRDINLSHNTFVIEAAGDIYDELLRVCHTQASHFHSRPRIESTLRDLCTLSDLMAFLIKSPEDVLLNEIAMRKGGLIDLLKQLTENGSGSHFMLCYHKLGEVRGLLTNQINNATMLYMKSLYAIDQEPLLPFLYFPNGVVYLDILQRSAPVIEPETLHKFVIEEIQEACHEIVEDGDALAFNPKGRLEYPRYFHDFLSVERFLALFVKNTLKDNKAKVAENTLQKMREMQAIGAIPAYVLLDYTPGSRVSMLGHFLINYLSLINMNLGKAAPHLKVELENYLIKKLGEDIWNEAQQIPSSGGVDYRFYWLAAQYLKTHPLADYESQSSGESLEGLFNELTHEMVQLASNKLTLAPGFQGPYLRNMPDYLQKNLTFGFSTTPNIEALPDFAAEFRGYSSAKKQRGSQLTCTICNSAYPIQEQKEASVLFQPWVYKNRLSLYKGTNAGGICSICSARYC